MSAELASRRRGLTLVEMVISIALVGVMLVAALNTVGAAKLGQRALYGRLSGRQLAEDLMVEILQQDYADAASLYMIAGGIFDTGFVTVTMGPEPGEDASGNRSAFDDLDDYNGWSASPPQEKDGTVMGWLAEWQRSVVVNCVQSGDLSALSPDEVGARRITVTVSRDGIPVAELVALRTVGPPPTEACCLDDGSCADVAADLCATLGGEPQGPGTDCYTAGCYTGVPLLLVVKNDQAPSDQELARQALAESWGFAVTLIDDSKPKADFDAAVADVEIAYVSEQVKASDLGTKLRNAPIGVVNEDEELVEVFGFASDTKSTDAQSVYVFDNTHYIVSEFAIGWLGAFSSEQHLYTLKGFASPQLEILAYTSTGGVTLYPSLAVLEEGAALYGGGTAAGRRVQLPWGRGGFDINALAGDGQTVMRRAIEWAAGMDE